MCVERSRSIVIGGLTIPLPCFFASISSVKANLTVGDYLQVIESVQYPTVLVSAYDIHHAENQRQETILGALGRLSERGNAVLLDSGNYESFWHRDKDWTVALYSHTCRASTYHAAFCFDKPNVATTADGIADGVVETVLLSQTGLASRTILPIVHGPPALLPEIAQLVARKLRPFLLAVPERALGDGITERATRVRLIRDALDQNGFYCPLHLLGTGNPLSLFVYACCGADSFDGLEWCQTVVDHANGQLHHLQQWDLFSMQTPMCKVSTIPFMQKALAHNLVFYDGLLVELQACLHDGTAGKWARRRFPDHLIDAVEEALGGDALYAIK